METLCSNLASQTLTPALARGAQAAASSFTGPVPKYMSVRTGLQLGFGSEQSSPGGLPSPPSTVSTSVSKRVPFSQQTQCKDPMFLLECLADLATCHVQKPIPLVWTSLLKSDGGPAELTRLCRGNRELEQFILDMAREDQEAPRTFP